MIDAAILDALLASGATAEMIVAAVKADAAKDEARKAARRAGAADRQRRKRARDNEARTAGEEIGSERSLGNDLGARSANEEISDPSRDVTPCHAMSRVTKRDTPCSPFGPPSLTPRPPNPPPYIPPETPFAPDGASRPKPVRTRYSEAFEAFWTSYPTTPPMAKKTAWDAWKRLTDEDRVAATEAVPRYRVYLASKPDHPVVHACRFLSQRRFDGFAETGTKSGPEQVFVVAGSPQWDAWLASKGKLGHPHIQRRIDGRMVDGWMFDSEWPPVASHGHARGAPARGETQADYRLNAHREVVAEIRANRRMQAMADVIGLDEEDGRTIEGELADENL